MSRGWNSEVEVQGPRPPIIEWSMGPRERLRGGRNDYRSITRVGYSEPLIQTGGPDDPAPTLVLCPFRCPSRVSMSNLLQFFSFVRSEPNYNTRTTEPSDPTRPDTEGPAVGRTHTILVRPGRIHFLPTRAITLPFPFLPPTVYRGLQQLRGRNEDENCRPPSVSQLRISWCAFPACTGPNEERTAEPILEVGSRLDQVGSDQIRSEWLHSTAQHSTAQHRTTPKTDTTSCQIKYSSSPPNFSCTTGPFRDSTTRPIQPGSSSSLLCTSDHLSAEKRKQDYQTPAPRRRADPTALPSVSAALGITFFLVCHLDLCNLESLDSTPFSGYTPADSCATQIGTIVYPISCLLPPASGLRPQSYDSAAPRARLPGTNLEEHRRPPDPDTWSRTRHPRQSRSSEKIFSPLDAHTSISPSSPWAQGLSAASNAIRLVGVATINTTLIKPFQLESREGRVCPFRLSGAHGNTWTKKLRGKDIQFLRDVIATTIQSGRGTLNSFVIWTGHLRNSFGRFRPGPDSQLVVATRAWVARRLTLWQKTAWQTLEP
ncbi:hypothetical protein MBM_04224 [Drepanopeziza brunnea f. sp. 'multigermtubi' MB_m1]|uniref:Uncharacterized protein n=1 Tax=Marssonina brunnea f. sp. multigermtubi (strain MB_m1) TaxID=1072389 RepID=K1X9E1_MARBU|nr:uncharacterized protein MBM_04224 [Drepanopeziza brunnea f. sp. 'multigermtubi' MB_m1]EKD17363.1 hypothetical protein MBM_04224 [Drepanopeziza brunnea f. sp. 'multigermtubi' MB_m1]